MKGFTAADLGIKAPEPLQSRVPAARRERKDGPPNNHEVHARFRQTYQDARKRIWLPVYDDMADLLEFRGIEPWRCAGAPAKGKRAGRYSCQKIHFCAYCWWRRTYRAGLTAALHHADAQTCVAFSLTLPEWRDDPLAVAEARRRLQGALRRRHGFVRSTLYIHTFGENPAEGPKGHVDGIMSGPASANAEVWREPWTEIRDVLDEYAPRDPSARFIHASFFSPASPRYVNDLVLRGMYAGRPTFHVPRVWAGLYGRPGAYKVRLTDVDRKSRPRTIQGHAGPDGTPSRHWSQRDLETAIVTAEEWRTCRALLGRNVSVSPRRMDEVLEATPLRYWYRLPGPDDLRRRYCK